jgi:hypothetical protein
VATKRPRGDVPSESLATVRVDRLIRGSRVVGPLFEAVDLARPKASSVRGPRVAGRVAFPAPSLTFSRHRVGLRGLPRGPCRRRSEDRLAGPLQLSSTSKRSLRAGSTPSSPGIRPLAPLRRHSPRVSTPGCPRAPFGRTAPPVRSRSASAVSHRPDGLLHPGAAGLLHPAAGHEVRRVSVARRQEGPEASCATRAFPATRLTPLEEFPSPAAVPRHRGRCPPAVAPRLARRPRWRRARALAPGGEVPRHRVACACGRRLTSTRHRASPEPPGSGDPGVGATRAGPDRGPAPARGPACPLRAPREPSVRSRDWARSRAPIHRPFPIRRARALLRGVADFRALLRRRVRSDPRRFQLGIALSFHGLRSPPRSSFPRCLLAWRLRGGHDVAPGRGPPTSSRHPSRGCAPPRPASRTDLALHRSLSGLGAATPPPAPPRGPRAPGRRGPRCRRPSWGL